MAAPRIAVLGLHHEGNRWAPVVHRADLRITSGPALVDDARAEHPRVTGGTDLTFDLAHAMPNIARAEFRVLDAGGGAGPWVAQTSPVLLWRVAPLDRAIEVRGVNLRGLPGPSTRVALVAP